MNGNDAPSSAPDAPASIVERLRAGHHVDDETFDTLYPFEFRAVSSVFWTPLPVALRAAELVAWRPGARVLDVGSGVGKFCIAAAAVTDATFVGVEARAALVRAAETAKRRAGVPRIRFVHGNFSEIDVSGFDALYFFNPFEEYLWPPDDRLDREIDDGEERFLEDVVAAQRMLARARVGTRVLTYHGFGGTMPASYRLIVRERHRSSSLDLWVKSEETRGEIEPDVDAVRRRLLARHLL